MSRFLTLCIICVSVSLPVVTEARRSSSIPTIIPRAAWGADESLGIVNSPERSENAETVHTHGSPSERVRKCQEAIRNHPEDFRTARTVKTDSFGRTLAWARRYSPEVKLLVIHHTGESDGSTLPDLPGKEQVQSIYHTHTVKNGWGDVGYHYLIDTEGAIYEGRAGGKNVVGAHAYCANVATLAITLVGNFQYTYPSEMQLSSLRQLLAHLGKEYRMNLNGKVRFQGKMLPTVLAHRDLSNTVCAGRKMQKLLPKIRRLAARGDFSSRMLTSLSDVGAPRRGARPQEKNTLTPAGTTHIRLAPRGTANLRLHYLAQAKPVKAGESIATMKKSDRMLQLWQHRSGSRIRTQRDIRSERAMQVGDRTIVKLTLLAPRKPGKYLLTIGEVRFTVEVVER